MANLFEKIYDWLVLSSVDPTKVSLTVKGALVSAAATATVLLGLAHMNLPVPADVNQVIDLSTTLIQLFFQGFGDMVMVVGLVRKIYLTVVGKNSVLTNV